MKKILDEGLLRSDFTFGFELEAFVSEGSDLMDEVRNSDDEYDYITDFLNGFFSKNGMTSLKTVARTHHDGSLEDYTGLPFEYSSNIYQVTPQNIEGLIKSLNEILNEGVFTNDTCGFHHHLKFNGITERDTVWIYCNMAMDPDWDEFSEFQTVNDGRISLFNDDYASYEDLDEISNAIENNRFDDVVRYLSTSKYRAFRIHPQGTIEWRGPRDFLATSNRKDIKNFYMLLLKLIDRIKKYMDSNILIGTDLTKKEFFENLSNSIKDKNIETSLEFISDPGNELNIKSRKSNRPFAERIVNKLSNIFMKNPQKFYEFVMKDNKGLPKYLRYYCGGGVIRKTLLDVIKNTLDSNIQNPKEFVSNLCEKLLPFTGPYGLLGQLGNDSNIFKYMDTDMLYKLYDDGCDSIGDTMYLTKLFIRKGIKLKLSQVYNKILKNSYSRYWSSIYQILYSWKQDQEYNLKPSQIYKIIVSLLLEKNHDESEVVARDLPDMLEDLFDNLLDKKDEFNNIVLKKTLDGNLRTMGFYVGDVPERVLYILASKLSREGLEQLPPKVKNQLQQLGLM